MIASSLLLGDEVAECRFTITDFQRELRRPRSAPRRLAEEALASLDIDRAAAADNPALFALVDDEL